MTRPIAILWIALAAPVCLICTGREVIADADEVSVFMHVMSRKDMCESATAAEQNHGLLLAGIVARLTYAGEDLYAYEFEIALARTMGVNFIEEVMFEGVTGKVERVNYFGRVQAGVRLRLGGRYIPTLHLAAGVTAQTVTQPRFVLPSDVVIKGPELDWNWAPVVSSGLGFDYRIDAHWVVGASIAAQVAFPLGESWNPAIEGGLHVGYFWYPQW